MKRIILIVTLLFVSTMYVTVNACTLFGCIGTCVKGNGVLIAKNRDARSITTWGIKKITPMNGKYKFLGMCADLKDDSSIRGGINEKGLCVFDADASTLRQEFHRMDTQNIIYKILANCTTVEEVIQSAKKYFIGTGFLMLSDKKELAYVEIAGDNNYEIRRIRQGQLYHTNHFIEPTFASRNEIYLPGSMIRSDRIEILMKSKDVLSLDDFILFLQDKNGGANNSIDRDGPARTLGSMCVYVPANPNQSPEAYLRVRNKGESAYKTSRIVLDAKFWTSQFNIFIL